MPEFSQLSDFTRVRLVAFVTSTPSGNVYAELKGHNGVQAIQRVNVVDGEARSSYVTIDQGYGCI